jgi:hypothetical protein
MMWALRLATCGLLRLRDALVQRLPYSVTRYVLGDVLDLTACDIRQGLFASLE